MKPLLLVSTLCKELFHSHNLTVKLQSNFFVWIKQIGYIVSIRDIKKLKANFRQCFPAFVLCSANLLLPLASHSQYRHEGANYAKRYHSHNVELFL